MWETSARLLKLLSLLQARRDWSGADLAARLEVSERTVRRDVGRLRFDYRSHDGTSAVRSAEPHRLVSWGRRWYLVAWDTERGDWRTFRVDRIAPRTPAGPRFTPRELPGGGDVAAYVARGVSAAA